jgi:hypothetical protein
LCGGGSGPACPKDYECVGGKCRRSDGSGGAGGVGGGGGDDGGQDAGIEDMSANPPTDGSKPVDMAKPIVVDMAAPGDLAGCASNARVCLDSKHSAACVAGAPVPDRTCPSGSTCTDGVCQPPSGAMACTRNIQCAAGEGCMAYSVANMLKGFCTQLVTGATKGEQVACDKAGWDDTCTTGLCTTLGTAGTFCAIACTAAGNCTNLTGAPRCLNISAPATLEGAPASVGRICAPPM